MTNWIYTDGAPFVCSTQTVRRQWKGIRGSSTGVAESDYERVCEAAGYLNVLACGTSQVLVLGDEPAQASFLQGSSGPFIARWIACDSLELADSVLAQIPDALTHLQPAIHFQIDEPELWMFDASSEGATSTGSELMLHIAPGRFEVTTESYRGGRTFDFWIHRFVRIPT